MSRNDADLLIVEAINVLREERGKKNLSHERLAALAKVHRTAVSHLENQIRKPTLSVFIRLSWALDRHPADVLAEAEQRLSK